MSGNGILVPGENGTLTGNIVTLTHGFKIELRPVPSRGNDSPSHEIYAITRHTPVRVGAAWEKTSNSTGETFLSLGIDDPSFDQPLYVTAFPRDGGGFEIVWRRPRQNRAARDTGLADDGIPF